MEEGALSTSQPRPTTCFFCNRGEDEKRYGTMVEGHGLTAHNFCLLFSSGLAQQGDDSEGLLGFLPQDVRKEKARSHRLRCSFCKKTTASIGCSKPQCKKSFHFGCGKDNGVMYIYNDDFRSYCKSHRLQQTDLTAEEKAKLTTAPNDSCIICYEPLIPAISDTTILSPCCTRAWYHRTCLEDMAYSAGLHFFKCPLCNNVDEWQSEMLQSGIYIPDRDASWELEPNAYHSLLETYTECEADECICPQGRREDQSDGEWELILCDTCGSQACHHACGNVMRSAKEWHCNVCRNVVASRQEVENVGSGSKSTSTTAHRQGRSRAIQEVTNII